MNRILASLSTGALLTAAAAAQCFEPDFGTLIGNGDDTLLSTVPMNINFPMGGTFATYDHVRVNTNGVAYLWNGSGTVSGTSTSGYATSAATMLTNLRGAVGGAPRIAPYWRDLNLTAGNGGGVWINSTYAGKCVITWANAVHWNVTETPFTFQAQLFDTGEVQFFYDGILNNANTVPLAGISQGGGIAAPAGATDLSVGATGVSVSPIVYETFDTALTWDLASTAVQFVPNVGGGYDTVATVGYSDCVHATHEILGTGCYAISDSVYQFFADAALASAALTNQSVVFTPMGATYGMSYGGGAYVAPGGGAVNVFATATDDGETSLAPSISLPTPQGPQASLRVHSNGIVSWGASALTFPGSNSYTPTPNAMLQSNNGGIYAWHDYNENESTPAPSGRIKSEEVVVGPDTILYLTWDMVENYSTPAATNPSTMQMQFNLTTGVVTIVWTNVDADTTTTFSSAFLVGYSAPGASTDGGSVDLSTALPLVVPTANAPAMTLTAAPIPVISPSTVVSYTMNNIVEAQPSSGIYLSTLFLSVNPLPGGFDLTGVLTGVPGCNAYVATLDLDLGAMVTGVPTATWNFTFDNVAFAPGNVIGAQGVALFDPAFPLGNGETGGFVFSNGVQSTTQLQ